MLKKIFVVVLVVVTAVTGFIVADHIYDNVKQKQHEDLMKVINEVAEANGYHGEITDYYEGKCTLINTIDTEATEDGYVVTKKEYYKY